MTNAVDMVSHPPHYNAYSIEVIEVTRHCSFNIGNAVKYMLRHLHKGTSKQDLEKAMWYLRDHIKTFDDLSPVVPAHAAGKLITLAVEYTEQEGSIPTVAAALTFLAGDNAFLAEEYLKVALTKVS